MADVKRLLDANANRAREAMRVMEDAARFLLDDTGLSRELKKLRHDFAAAMRKVPGIEFSRDTPGDVGTAITTKTEWRRDSVRDVAVAAGKRLSEALRCLEEFGKLLSPEMAAAVKQLRYRAYELEKRLLLRLPVFAGWRVCVILSEHLCTHHGWLDVARASLDGGADCIQLREKSLESDELLERAAKLVALAGKRAAVIINDRPDVALLAGAAGVHLGQTDLPIAGVRRIAGRQLLIGSSTHNLAEARRADTAGADYCGVGAIFQTTTKNIKHSGLEYLREFVVRYPMMKHLAIGGITPLNVDQVVCAGGRGVAVSSIVCGAQKPAAVVRKLLRVIP